MVIQSLTLKNYRNYTDFHSSFNPGINFIYGDNGQGKTNLVESMFFLTHLKSFRTAHLHHLLKSGSDNAAIQMVLTKQNVNHEILVNLWKNKKSVLLDLKKVSYSSDYIKNFYSLLFAPDQLSQFKEYPLERRSFFDRVLFIIDSNYVKIVKEFNRIRKQKNSLLRNREISQLPVWNQLLSDAIPRIVKLRDQMVTEINPILSEMFSELTGRSEILQLSYHSDFLEKKDPIEIYEFLSGKADSECSKGYMCYGPQRDDFWMTLDGKKDKETFSQGEYRIAFLTLQLAINQLIRKHLSYYPILLLDDIISELDETVYKKSIEYISNKSNQVFITTTAIPKPFFDLGTAHHIHQGKIVSAS